MALDGALLADALAHPGATPALRLYRWNPPTLTIGAKVSLPQPVRERCAAAGVVIASRPTGGGCVLHDGDLTYAVVAPDRGGVLENYRWVSASLIAGLAVLGIEARVAEHPTVGRPLNCFEAPTGADLSCGGRKFCGSAQARRGGWFLQHGSIPLMDVRAKTAALLGDAPGPGTGDGADGASTCLDQVKPGITWQDLAGALVEGFRATWGPDVRTTAAHDVLVKGA